MKKHLQLLHILLLIILCKSRQFETTLTLRQVRQENSWLFLDKIALSQGKTTIKIETIKQAGQSFGTSGQIFVDIVMEDDWQKDQKLKCKNQIRSPVIIHKLMLDGSQSVSQTQLDIQRSQMVYFVLKDCNKRFISDYSNQKMFIQIKIITINNGSHLGEQQNDHWMIIPLVLFCGVWLLFSDKQFLRETHQSDPDYSKLVLFAGISTNISSLFWKSIGFFIYSYFGINYLFFHLVYLFMHALSQTIIIGFLILVGFGWSINFSGKDNIDLIMPAFCLIASVNIVTCLLTQLSSASHDMHHSFDAIAGTVLIIQRICLSILFLCGLIYTYTYSRHEVKKFLVFFGILSFLYISSLPLVVYLANNCVSIKNRNEFVFVLVELIKTFCNISLRYMVGSSKSGYSRINFKNASFLPSDTAIF